MLNNYLYSEGLTDRSTGEAEDDVFMSRNLVPG
jgi:hypothetical protein